MAEAKQRQCIGCAEKKDKRELIRIVRVMDNTFELDETGRKNGRGAYVCKSMDCFEKACKKHSFEKSFKEGISGEIIEKLKGEFERLGY